MSASFSLPDLARNSAAWVASSPSYPSGMRPNSVRSVCSTAAGTLRRSTASLAAYYDQLTEIHQHIGEHHPRPLAGEQASLCFSLSPRRARSGGTVSGIT